MSRRHAHSKPRRGDPPRTYNAATGLTGVSEAELARRTEITEAAMALAEASAAKTRQAAKSNAAAQSSNSPRFKLPTASRSLAEGPPRVFTLPAEPVPTSGTGAGVRIPMPTAAALSESESMPPAPSPAAQPSQAPSPKAPLAGALLPKRPTTTRVKAGDTVDCEPAVTRSARALVGKLTATVAATEAAMAKAVNAAKPAKPDRAEDAVGPPKPITAKTPAAPSVPTKPPSTGTPSTDPVPKASRAPKGGSRWRTRTPVSAGVANRRPMSKSRPASAPSSAVKSRRFALPLVGRKVGESESAPNTEAKTRAAMSASTISRHNSFSRTTRATAAGATKKKPTKAKAPATPQERRQRIPLVLAGVFAVAVLATSFPLSSLLSQHRELAAAASQLQQVQRVNQALTQQQHALDSNVAVNQFARSNYQMVTPGQTLYDVLPPSHSTAATTQGSATSGDPGSQPLVAPANAPDLSPQPGLPQPIPTTAAGSSSGSAAAKSGTPTVSNAPIVPPAPSSFWGRVSDTLQFWK